MNQQQHIALAITGASGAQYGLRLLQCLIQANCRVSLMISDAAIVVINTETDLCLPNDSDALETFFRHWSQAKDDQLRLYSKHQWGAPVASGSAPLSAMVVCPCSMGTLSAITNGASNNLIERAADVCLKERRPLYLVPRETPLSAIHLEHMLKMTQLGAVVIPASPGFYQRPQTIEDMVDFVVARILNQLQLPQTLLAAWGTDD